MGGHAANLRRQQRLSGSKIDATIRRVRQRRFQVTGFSLTMDHQPGRLQTEKDYPCPSNPVRRGWVDNDGIIPQQDTDTDVVYLYPPKRPQQTEGLSLLLLLVLQMLFSTALTPGMSDRTPGYASELLPGQGRFNARLQCADLGNRLMTRQTTLAIHSIPKLKCPALFHHLALWHQPKPSCKATFAPQITALTIYFMPKFQTTATYQNIFHCHFSWHGKVHEFKQTALTIRSLPKRQCKVRSHSNKAIQKDFFSQRFQPNVQCQMPKILLKIKVESIIPNSGHDYGPLFSQKRRKHSFLFLRHKANLTHKLFCKLLNSLTKMILIRRCFKHNSKSRYK